MSMRIYATLARLAGIFVPFSGNGAKVDVRVALRFGRARLAGVLQRAVLACSGASRMSSLKFDTSRRTRR